MKAIAELEQEQASEVTNYNRDTIIRMEEGLIGFSGCKDFVLMAKPEIAPFQMLKCINAPDISFLVLNPKVLVPNYYDSVPEREWESIGITDKRRRLAFAISIIGRTPREGSANLQAPLLMNYEAMIARQVILTDSGFSFRHPLI
jgi:flagellar assembly factor FliW